MKIVIDANLLLLLVVGLAGEQLIGKNKRLQNFGVKHFRQLRTFIEKSSGIVVTPHSLTELWHLIGEQDRKFDADKNKVQQITLVLMADFLEVYQPSKALAENPSISRLGLSDVGQIHAGQQGYTLISVDSQLCHEASLQNVRAINFRKVFEGS